MEKQILHYDFTEVNSTIVGDVSGQGMAGVVRRYDAGGMRFGKENIYGQELEVMMLPGGEQGGYLELPTGVLQNNEGLTISFWCRLHKASRGDMLFAFGYDKALYVRIQEQEEGYVLIPCITSGGTSQEWQAVNDVVLQKDRWYMITITLEKEAESFLKYYIDARETAVLKSRRMAAVMLYEAAPSYFGVGLEGTIPVKVDLADIRIYAEVLDPDAVDEMLKIEDAARIQMDAQKIRIPEATCENLILPKVGDYGSKIRWESDHTHILDEQGYISRPEAGASDVQVILRAWVSYGEAVQCYEYPVCVKALPTEEQIVEHDAALLAVPGYHHVYCDLDLPSRGEWGSDITYVSSEPAWVDRYGCVHRPMDQKVSVVLTATLQYGEAVRKKEIKLTVVPERSIEKKIVEKVDKSKVFYKNPGIIKGRRVSLGAARMRGSHIYLQNRERDLEYLRLLDADRMLYNFRSAYGQDTRGVKPLGGWDEPMGLLRGHSTGHFLSALAYAYAGTGDMELKRKLDYMVSELRSLQKMSGGRPEAFKTACSPNNASQRLWSRDPSVWGEGFLSAYPPDQFALLEQYTPYATIWAPYYTLHKILAGLLDTYKYASNETALEIACGIGDWVSARLSSLSEEQRTKMWAMYIAGEYGGMNESMSTLYLLTGCERYRTAAAMFDNPGFFNGLAEGLDTVAGRHANQHIPQIIGALEEYRTTGDEKYYKIAYHFWRIVTQGYTYATGGVGRGEMFKEAEILAGNIEGVTNCETCAAYNMLKLTQELYRYDPDCVEYMDYYERTQLNQIAASQTPYVTEFRHNGVTYMLPVGPGAHRSYSSDYDDFSCCHGTGMENHVKYQENIYYETPEAIYVNLYIPSELSLDTGRLELSGDLPGTQMKLKVIDTDVTVRLRVPYWCRKEFSIVMNGYVIKPEENRGYVELDLKDGESVDISLPYRIHLDFTPDLLEGSQVAAVMYGPLVMAAISEETQWQELLIGTDLSEDLTVSWEAGKPRLDYYGLRFIPMYEAHEMGYHAYVKVKEV